MIAPGERRNDAAAQGTRAPMTDWIVDRLERWQDKPAVILDAGVVTYAALLRQYHSHAGQIDLHAVRAGDVVAVQADQSAASIAVLLAIAARGAIAMPLPDVGSTEALEHAGARWLLEPRGDGDFWWRDIGARDPRHPLIDELVAAGEGGLILLSSGSTGGPKLILHSFTRLLARFVGEPRKARATIGFLKFDHIGGLNTALHTCACGGTLVGIRDRSVDTVCAAIQAHAVELLPTSPTFLNMLIVQRAHERYDLSSLELISYGTEVMPASTLRTLHAVLPQVRLLQTYGLSELGILASASGSSDSLWMRLGGEGVEAEVRDGVLWVRSAARMVGYLNSPSPFVDGWFCTGDRVEVNGDTLRVLGRASEVINVGGEKVHPAEVESVILEMSEVVDAVAFAHPSAVTGQVVGARICPSGSVCADELRRRVRSYCAERLPRHMVPLRIELVARDAIVGERQKRLRRWSAPE
ncbi:MAG: fadD [Betaproteobacteria bacterium]|nr:fadD [Betaproteobacteria bacterium]